MSFTHKQGRFEGPYHKLLELIEERKLSINEISLALIADEYISYIKSLSTNTTEVNIDKSDTIEIVKDTIAEVDNKDDISQFIVVASTLMLIKAKSLLPTMEYSKEEKAEVANLEYKLNLYKVLIDSSKLIKKLWHKQNYNREKMKFDIIVFAPGNVRSITLQSVSILTIVKLPHLERLKSVAVAQAIKIENVIDDIMLYISSESIQNAGSHITLSFKDIYNNILIKYRNIKNNTQNNKEGTEKNQEKTYKIVSFLGILDLIRKGLIEAEQSGEDISLSPSPNLERG